MAEITIHLTDAEQQHLEQLLAQLHTNGRTPTTNDMHRAVFIYGIRSLGLLLDQLHRSPLRDWQADIDGSPLEN